MILRALLPQAVMVHVPTSSIFHVVRFSSGFWVIYKVKVSVVPLSFGLNVRKRCCKMIIGVLENLLQLRVKHV